MLQEMSVKYMQLERAQPEEKGGINQFLIKEKRSKARLISVCLKMFYIS